MLKPMKIVATSDRTELITVPPGIEVARRVDVHATGVRDHLLTPDDVKAGKARGSVEVDLTALYDEELGRYRITRLTFDAEKPGAAEVTGSFLRSVRVQEVIRRGVGMVLQIPMGHYHPDVLADYSPDELTRAHKRGPSERVLWSVAFVYRAAELRNDNPASNVAAAFAIQPRTATNWIRRARELGMLDRMAPAVESVESVVS